MTPTDAQMTRADHLAWAKRRAIEYVERGDTSTAFISMISDLGKHAELTNHPAIPLGTKLYIGGHIEGVEAMRRFIEGFN